MKPRQTALRNEPHEVSFRPALVRGKKSGELFITLKTRNCPWGRCLFCGLGKTDGEKPPLMHEEAAAQARRSIDSFVKEGGKPDQVGKVSIITNSDSVFNPLTVSPEALPVMLEIIGKELPALSAIEFESRAEFIRAGALLELSQHMGGIFGGAQIARSICVGIESPHESVRNAIRKGLPDSLLFKAAGEAEKANLGLRGYFIYNLIEPEGVGRAQNLIAAVDLMANLAATAPGLPSVSILVIRGYVPGEFAATPLFLRFAEVPDAVALRELQQAAVYAKTQGVRFEVDSTTADQQNAASLTFMSPSYIAALVRYNTTLNPEQLKL